MFMIDGVHCRSSQFTDAIFEQKEGSSGGQISATSIQQKHHFIWLIFFKSSVFFLLLENRKFQETQIYKRPLFLVPKWVRAL